MAKIAIELDDSEISAIYAYKAALIVFLRAHLHKTQSEPLKTRGAGWIQSAEIKIPDGTLELSDITFPCQIVAGTILVDEIEHRNVIPIPLTSSETSMLKLECLDADGRRRIIDVQGSGVQVVVRGDPVYIEDVPGIFE